MNKETSLSLYRQVSKLKDRLEYMDAKGTAISHAKCGHAVEKINEVFKIIERRTK